MQHQLASQADLLKTQDQDLQSLNKDHVEVSHNKLHCLFVS